MRASEIMSRPVVSIGPNATIREAVVLLTEHGFAGLPVVDQDDRVIGVLTETDALNSGLGHGGADLSVDSAMTVPAEVATPETDASELARRMIEYRLRCIPIVDNGVLVGVVSRRDLLRPLVRRDDAIAAGVRALIDDYAGQRGRWTVHVLGGTVTLSGEFADEAERGVLAALARTVPGVGGVELLHAHHSAQH